MRGVTDVLKRIARQRDRNADGAARLAALIVEARAAGISLRGIAPAAGLSYEQVRKIWQAAQAENATTEG